MRRLVLPAVLLATALGATTASAAPPDITDPSGDALAGQSSYDVVSVDYSIVKGKTLSVTMKLAGAPSISPGTSYQLGAETGCGHLFVFSYVAADGAPAHSWQFARCGGEDATQTDGEASLSFDPNVELGKDSITWSIPVKALPKEVALKAGFTELLAYTAVTEPVVGYATADFLEESAIDFAKGDKAKF